MFKIPKNNQKYSWTWHVVEKMKYYKISSSRVKSTIRYPDRTEEGIAPNTIASMRVIKSKKRQEVWVMYQTAKKQGDKKIRIITSWIYPGESLGRNPVPNRILEEIKELL